MKVVKMLNKKSKQKGGPWERKTQKNAMKMKLRYVNFIFVKT